MNECACLVRKLTDEYLMREACEMTFLGTSRMSLLSIYKSEHSPARTQLFWIKLYNIPLFIATHLLRHHVGSVPFQLTCRDDRAGHNPNLRAHTQEIKAQMLQLDRLYSEDKKEEANVLVDCIDEHLTWVANNTDRYTPVNLGLCINAQSLIDMAKMRLCKQAHHETIEVFKVIKERIEEVDEDLAKMMVSKCVYRNGLCGEPRCCGYNNTEQFQKERAKYLTNFTIKQAGCVTAIKNND